MTGSTKASLATTLYTLQEEGYLNGVDRISQRAWVREVSKAGSDHANAQTPYGKLVQRMFISNAIGYIEYISPFAFLWYLASLSSSFAGIMEAVSNRTCDIVLYVDGLTPGNPFRPEKARHVQCFYWCISQWPQWLLCRTFAWAPFAFIRTTTIDAMPGKMSFFIRKVLRMFWPRAADMGAGVHSFERGVTIPTTDGAASLFRAGFRGFLADLVGHKEITEWKGHSGIKCCLNCSNLVKRKVIDAGSGLVGICCWDPARFEMMSNDDIFATIDLLHATYGTTTATKFKQLETDIGWNCVPDGLLADKSLRSVFQPTDHALRDWMHCCVGDGIANSEIAAVWWMLKANGVRENHLQDFSLKCILPREYGTVSKQWFSPARLRNNTVASFASIVLSMTPIVYMYLQVMGFDTRWPQVFRCFELLHHMLGLFKLGAEGAIAHVDRIEQIIVEHHRLFQELHGEYVKPKLHHVQHIVQHMRYLGRLLSCFVTERKHRIAKDSALHVFRHFEHTVLAGVLNKQCEQIQNNDDIFKPVHFHRPGVLTVQGLRLHRSSTLVCHCGIVTADDLVFFKCGTAGKVAAFWCMDLSEVDDAIVEVHVFPCVENNPSIRLTSPWTLQFLKLGALVDTCIYAQEADNRIRLVIPPAAIYL